MHKTKGYKALLATAGVALFAAANSYAFTSLQKVSTTAQAQLSGAGSVTMSVAVKKVADNGSDTQVNWSNVTLPTRWKVADNYIQLTNSITASGGGIQTYTDNMGTSASPKFTGDRSVVTPAGLIDATDTTKKLPTAWTIRHATGTVSAADPGAGNAQPESFLWFYHEDRSQLPIPTSNASAFTDGDPFVTVANANGIHYAQSNTSFGAPAANPALADSVSNIYLEADFGNAVTPRTYATNSLILESYNQ